MKSLAFIHMTNTEYIAHPNYCTMVSRSGRRCHLNMFQAGAKLCATRRAHAMHSTGHVYAIHGTCGMYDMQIATYKHRVPGTCGTRLNEGGGVCKMFLLAAGFATSPGPDFGVFLVARSAKKFWGGILPPTGLIFRILQRQALDKIGKSGMSETSTR